MSFKLSITVFSIVLFSLPINGQVEKLFEFNVRSDFFSTDIDGNIYYTESDSLVKLRFKSWEPITYHFSSRYKFTSIDVSNPEYISLYSQDSRQLLILDSSLDIRINPFYLDQIGLFEVSKVFTDESEHIWMYNFLSENIIRLNKSFQLNLVSKKLKKIYPTSVDPNYFTIKNGLIYINFPGQGILILNDMAILITFLRFEGIYDFQVRNDEIFYYRDQVLHRFNIKTFKAREISVPPEPGIKNVHFFDPYLIIQTKDKILVYLTE